MSQIISCYCGSSEGKPLRTHVRGGKRQPIARCKQCGVVQKAEIEEEKHDEFHKKGGQTAEIALDSMSDSYTDRNLVDVRRRLADLRPMLEGGEALLDFGTGMGHFLEAINPFVGRAVGSEINWKRLSFVREKLGFEVCEGTDALMQKFGRGHFDIVTMYHTLEHLPNPLEQLEKVRELLTEDGFLVVEVPNHDDWLIERSESYADFYYQDAHAYYFDQDTLQDVLRRAGFSAEIKGVQRYSYHNALHWLFNGEPELDAPSRFRNTWANPVDKVYASILRGIHSTDTLYCIGRN